MAYAGTITLTQIPANQIFQRGSRTGGAFGRGTGAIPVSLSLSAPATLLEAQLRDANNPSSVLAPWFPVGTNLAVGAQTLSLAVPAAKAWFLLDLRANSDPTSVASTSGGFGMGEVVLAAGQSLVTDFWDTSASGDSTTIASLGVALNPFGAAFAGWNTTLTPSGWAVPSDGGPYKSTFAAEFLRLAVAAANVNVALVGYGYNATVIASWLPGQPNYATLTTILAQAGGSFGTLLWCQGHQDAKSPGANASAYLSGLQQIVGALAQACPITFNRILCSIPAIGTAAATRFDAGSIGVIRGCHLQYVSQDPQARYVAGLDVALSADGIHPSQAGNITLARHFYRAFMAGIGGRSTGDDGPKIVGGFRARATAQIMLVTQSATPLVGVGNPALQFQVYPAGQVTGSLPIASVDFSRPSKILINLAVTPADGQALDVYYRTPWDDANAISGGLYDSVLDADGLTTGRQVGLLAAPVRSAAPIWHRPLLAASGRPIQVAPGIVAFAG